MYHRVVGAQPPISRVGGGRREGGFPKGVGIRRVTIATERGGNVRLCGASLRTNDHTRKSRRRRQHVRYIIFGEKSRLCYSIMEPL